MSAPEEIRNLTEGVVASFDSGIDAVSLLIEKGLELLDGYRQEEEAIRGSLKESMAALGSLRRTDFDCVTERVLNFQLERERTIKLLIKNFLVRQKDLARRLRRSLQAGLLEEVRKIQEELGAMIEGSRTEIVDFQQEQRQIRETFQQLESHKEKLQVKDFKKAIQDLETTLMGDLKIARAL